MKHEKLYIKNMVCPRCIKTVRQLLDGLSIAIAKSYWDR